MWEDNQDELYDHLEKARIVILDGLLDNKVITKEQYDLAQGYRVFLYKPGWFTKLLKPGTKFYLKLIWTGPIDPNNFPEEKKS